MGLSDTMSGGRNRGRLPYLELDIQEAPFEDTSTSGGMTRLVAVVRGWYRNFSQDDGQKRLRTMLYRVSLAVRNWRFNGATGYEPGQTSTYERIYEDAELDFPVMDRGPGVIYGELRITIPIAYSESDLQ